MIASDKLKEGSQKNFESNCPMSSIVACNKDHPKKIYETNYRNDRKCKD